MRHPMKNPCTLVLALLASVTLPTFAAAQTYQPGQQCQPAVADASRYHRCRIVIVRGNEVCRCAMGSQALRRPSDVMATGSVARTPGGALAPTTLQGPAAR